MLCRGKETIMKQIDVYLEGFKLNYEKFLIGCDALEEERKWPVDKLGDMDVYFANDLMCVIVRLIAADGHFEPGEVDYLNNALGFEYTVDELQAVYDECGDTLGELFEKELPESIRQIRELNPLLADNYQEMLSLIGKIMIESDGVITPEEKAAAEQLIAAMEG